MKIYQKIFGLFCSAFTLISLATPANATDSTLYTDIALPLPRACLPVKARMKPYTTTNGNDRHCHCPPVDYCTQTVTFTDPITNITGTHNKLSGPVRKICCPTTPPPPPPPTTTTTTILPPSQCEVHYFKYSSTNTSASGCKTPDYTHIGTRAAGYCIKYTNPSNPASVTSLNTCLNTCDTQRTNIRNNSGFITNYNEVEANTKANQIKGMTNQIRLRTFVECREDCFNNNSFPVASNTLMQQSEINLNRWIVMPLVDNATDQQLQSQSELQILFANHHTNDTSQTDERRAAEKIKTYPAFDTQLKHFTAKTYGPIVTHLFNQRNGTGPASNENVFNWFFQNTYNLSATYTAIPHTIEISDLESKMLGQPPFTGSNAFLGSDGGDTQVDYFNRQLNAANNSFTSLNVLTASDSHTPSFQNYNGITCDTYAYIGLCVTIYTNASGCETCLAPETKITMADGTLKVIKDLKEGEQVKAPDNKTAQIESVAQLDWKDLTLYNINDGQLRLTADHPIMTTQGWRAVNYKMRKHNNQRYGLKNVKTLKIGDIIITQNGEIPVTRIMPEAPVKDGKTFNLKLKGNTKGFYANGILVRSQN